MKRFLPLLLVLVVLRLSGDLFAAERYVEVTKDNVNIRSAASTRSQTLGRANQGDVFHLTGEKGSWYEIELFSGEARFVHKSLARPVSYKPQAPEDPGARQQIFQALINVAERAEKEANDRFPPEKDLKKNLDYILLLNDRYKLELFQQNQIQAPIYRRIMIEGGQKGW
jgi:hypothetical protein